MKSDKCSNDNNINPSKDWLCPLDKTPVSGLDSYLDPETKLIYHVSCAREMGLLAPKIPLKQEIPYVMKKLIQNNYITCGTNGEIRRYDARTHEIGILLPYENKFDEFISGFEFYSISFLIPRRKFVGVIEVNMPLQKEKNDWKLNVFGEHNISPLEDFFLPLAEECGVGIETTLTHKKEKLEKFSDSDRYGRAYFY